LVIDLLSVIDLLATTDLSSATFNCLMHTGDNTSMAAIQFNNYQYLNNTASIQVAATKI